MENFKGLISFYSAMPKMIDVFPEPEPANKNIPDWYKKMEGYFNNDQVPHHGTQNLTIKKCQAIFDTLSSGYIFKCPVDIYIDTTDGKSIFEVANNLNFAAHALTGSHANAQYSLFPIDESVYVKDLLRINPMWYVKTEPGHSCLFTSIMHDNNSPIIAVPGIIDTDDFYSEGLLSFLVKKDFKGFIKKGTPIMQVIPFKRFDYEYKIIKDKNIDEKLKVQQLKIRSVFSSGYKKFFWKRKKYE